MRAAKSPIVSIDSSCTSRVALVGASAGTPRKETHLRAEDRLRGPEPKPRAKPANSLQLPLFDSFEHKYSHDITARGGARESLSG